MLSFVVVEKEVGWKVEVCSPSGLQFPVGPRLLRGDPPSPKLMKSYYDTEREAWAAQQCWTEYHENYDKKKKKRK